MSHRFLALSLAILSLAAAPVPPPTISYTLTPLMQAATPRALAVDIRFRGDASGHMTFDLPDKSMGEQGRWRKLSGFRVQGASLRAPTPATRELVYAPGSQVSLHYEVAGAYAQDPAGLDGNAYKGVALRPAWLAGLGEFVFATPKGGDQWPARFAWGALPKGWRFASDLAQKPRTVTDIVESTFLAGRDVTTYRRPISGGILTLAVRGQWNFNTAKLADDIARTVTAQREFWGRDVGGDFLVTLFPLTGAGSSGGTGRGDGFALYGTPDTGAASFRRTIAHENIHGWIPTRIGAPREGDNEPSAYWFSEGFTEFYTQRTLLRAGIWSLEDAAADLNDKLLAYAASPVRNASNREIVKGFWTSQPLEELPYQRGLLLALNWDHGLRRSGKGNLDRVMFAARDRAAAAAKKPDAQDNMLAALRRAGFDPAPDVAHYVEAGATISLAPDLFGDCAAVRSISIAAFDPGFDREKSARIGRFAGVDPKGPAFAAGLRNGMKRIAREGGKEGDSRVPLVYRIADAGAQERVIRYLPAGRGRQALQEIALAPNLSQARRAACARTMSGG